MPPFRIRKAPKRDLYWVVGEDGKHHSKDPIPKERALAQMRALYRAERLKGGIIDRATFEWRKTNVPGYYPADLTYEDFARAEGANEEFIKAELEKLRKQNEAYYAAVSRGEIEEEVACKLDANLEYNRDVVPKSVCAQRHEERRKKDMTPTQRVFDDINKGLSKVADWSVENVMGNLPVVGQVVGSTYKEFAPPTSKFYKPMGEKGVAERIADAGINVAEIQKKKGEKKDEKKAEGAGVSASTAGLLYDLSALLALVSPYLTSAETERVDEMYRTYQTMAGQPTTAEAAKEYLIARYKPALERLVDKYASRIGDAAESGFGRRGRGAIRRKFKDELKHFGLSPASYIARARAAAKADGYDPKSLTFSDDDVAKLMITDDSGRKVRFGRVGYGDFLLWSAAEKKGKVKNGFAAQKRDTFQKSHSQIKGDWKSNKYSPNSLALAILW